MSGRWWRFTALAVIAVVVLVPLVAVVALSVLPSLGSAASGPTLENYITVFTKTDVTVWVGNSLLVTLATVVSSDPVLRVRIELSRMRWSTRRV